MNNALHRTCCCPVCDCGEDCNGVWGTPNEDKAFQCCWSVGDKILYRHTTTCNYSVRTGGPTTPFNCYPATYTCGIVDYTGIPNIEVEYVCIGARGNYHNREIDPRLPEFINGRSWEGEPVFSPTKDGYNVPPIVYVLNPLPGQIFNDPPTKSDYENGLTIPGKYIQQNSYVPGCAAEGWDYRHYDKYDGFEIIETSIGTEVKYSWEPKLKGTDENDLILTQNIFCGVISDCLSSNNKTINVCKSGQEGNCNESDIAIPSECWNENNERLNKCDPNTDCSCYGIDENGNVFGKNEHKLFQYATIFALDITNPEIKYCSSNGYWIEGQVRDKWFKYSLHPYLVLFNRPIREWLCDCKDTDDNYILPEGVGPGKKREVIGGFTWYGWNGNCECNGIDCCEQNLDKLAPCVQRCMTIDKRFAAGNSIVPCSSFKENGNYSGPLWRPFGEASTFSGYSTADFFKCTNCVEAISSCSGFKSYCIIRDTNMPVCPGQCQSFYGIMEDPDNCSKRFDQKCDPANPQPTAKDLSFGCKYGCPQNISCSCTFDGQSSSPLCQTFSAKSNEFGLIFPAPYIRTECKDFAINILTITPVEDDSRRCNWYQWDGIGNDGKPKQYRCCGSSGRYGGRDIGETAKIYPPEGDISFSWTEGIGWESTCEDLGKECGGFYYEGPSKDYTDAKGGGFGPDVNCNEGKGCGGVQCSGETESWISFDDLAKGDYSCYLGTTQRGCCQLSEEYACACEWWPYSKQKSHEPKYWREEVIKNLDEYWNLQTLISNEEILVGCKCVPPSCNCEGPGNYIDWGDSAKCIENSYNRLASEYNCSSGCLDYIGDPDNCNYDPDNAGKIGTSSSICKDPDCESNSICSACPDGKCATFCVGQCCNDITNICIDYFDCICDGDCKDLCPEGYTYKEIAPV